MLPLTGLKVLDLSRYIAGPHCASVLGDLGADVVKVERRAVGDDTRAFAPQVGGESIYFMMFNRNKRSLTLDFRNKDAQDLLRRLAKEADVLIENFRPGTMELMGCGWPELSALNPRLVMARISGYGQKTSMADKPCFDGIAQAISGLMDLTGDPNGPPMMAGTFLVDYSTALYACVGVLAAITRRQATGRGEELDVSLMGSATSLLMTAIPEYSLTGQMRSRAGNRDRYAAPANTFRAKDDRWVHIIAGGDAFFKRFTEMIGRADLQTDPRFSTLAARMKNVDEAEAIVADWAITLPASEVVEMLTKADLPCALIATIKDVVENPYMRESSNIVDVQHPTAGTVPMSGPVIRLSQSESTVSPAPLLGEHTAEVLADWLKLTETEIERLKAAKAV